MRAALSSLLNNNNKQLIQFIKLQNIAWSYNFCDQMEVVIYNKHISCFYICWRTLNSYNTVGKASREVPKVKSCRAVCTTVRSALVSPADRKGTSLLSCKIHITLFIQRILFLFLVLNHNNLLKKIVITQYIFPLLFGLVLVFTEKNFILNCNRF